jgi:hypothetical protein
MTGRSYRLVGMDVNKSFSLCRVRACLCICAYAYLLAYIACWSGAPFGSMYFWNCLLNLCHTLLAVKILYMYSNSLYIVVFIS